MRTVPLDMEHLSLNMDTVMDYVDDYTIGIVAILGITYTGKYDDVKALDKLVEQYNKKKPDLPIRIHVDAASGGMVALFIEPELKWDFRLKNVWSISRRRPGDHRRAARRRRHYEDRGGAGARQRRRVRKCRPW